ncbi:MAG: response regulator receiver protein, partial [Candidatus Dormibacteraceae bacterium]
GYFVLYFQTGSSCGGGAATVTVGENGVTTEGIHMLLSVALTAFTAGKPVQVAYDNGTSQCFVNRILMTN